MYDLVNIFETFLPQLLTYPNPVDPLNGDAAALYLHKPEEYKAKVREYVKKYATEEALKNQENNRSSSHHSNSSFSGSSGAGTSSNSGASGSSTGAQSSNPGSNSSIENGNQSIKFYIQG